MNPQAAYDMIARDGIVAGTRGKAFTPEVTLKVARVLVEEGFHNFELTMNSSDPLEAMQLLKREFGDEACVGMGTVLSVDDARRVIDAGADFVVSPAFQPQVVQAALDADVLVVPGVITPSEAVQAWDMGLRLLKIFPIGPLGLDYFQALRGPLDHISFMCNGGIDAQNTRDFLKAGAVACGVMGWLTGDGTLAPEVLRSRARTLRNAVTEARTGHKVVTL